MKIPVKITHKIIIILTSLFSFSPAFSQQVAYAVIGDFGSGDSNETLVANLVKSWNPQFVITTGDDRYGSNTFDASVGADYCEFLKGAQSGIICDGNGSQVNSFFPSTGNHEYTDGDGINEYLSYFDLPGAGVQSSYTSGSEKFYDFVQGPIHFFVLDSYDATVNGTLENQKSWLENQMAASNSIWKVVYFHHPPYSSSSNHGSEETMRWPFAEWGADAVLNGHDHTYERLHKDNVVYFVNGLGGMSKYGFSTPITESAIQYNAEFGAQKVVADDFSMTFSFININNVVIDEYTVYKTDPPTVNILNPLDNTHFDAPGNVVITAEANDSDGTVSQVEFYLNNNLIGTVNSEPYTFNCPITENGAYSITAKATDNYGVSAISAPIGITVGSFSGTVVSQISSGNDDVEEAEDGYMYANSSDIELVYDTYAVSSSPQGNQTIGLRFNNLMIPQGAIITSAKVQFTCDEMVNDDGMMTIFGHNSDDSPAFTSEIGNVTGRAKTSVSVTWNPPAWTAVGSAGPDQQTPEISSIIQEIINRPGFSLANSISIIITGTGRRVAEAYDGAPTSAAELHIEFYTGQPPADDTPPVITLTGEATIDLELGDAYSEQGATATDNIDGNISNNVVIGGDAVNTNLVNTYVVTYNVIDAAGNAATQVTRTVNVNNKCTASTTNFNSSTLTYSGSGSYSTSVTIPTGGKDVSFNVSGLDEQTGGKPSKRYTEEVTITYVDREENIQTYGVFSGTSSVNVSIPEIVKSVTVGLTDGYGGNSSTTLSVDLSIVDFCFESVQCDDSDGDGICDESDICPGGDDKVDTDGDGIPDFCDLCDDLVDSDGDGVSDCTDLEVNSPCPNTVDANGVSVDSDDDGVCDELDQCPGYDDSVDLNGNEIPDGCDVPDCVARATSFNSSTLTHSGSGSNFTSVTIPTGGKDVSFNVSGLDEQTGGKPSKRYIEEVTITYIDGDGNNQIYGVFSGTSSVNVSIPEIVKSVTVGLTDGYDGNSSTTLSVDLSIIVDFCIESSIAPTLKSIGGETVLVAIPMETEMIPGIDYALKVYPNPFNEEINISIDGSDNFANAIVHILDISGRMMYNEVYGNQKKITISDLPLSPGTYFIRVQFGEFVKTEQLIKTK